jgi:hypothetical protein
VMAPGAGENSRQILADGEFYDLRACVRPCAIPHRRGPAFAGSHVFLADLAG